MQSTFQGRILHRELSFGPLPRPRDSEQLDSVHFDAEPVQLSLSRGRTRHDALAQGLRLIQP